MEVLADSGASVSIISMGLEMKLIMTIYDKGDATLKDTSKTHLDVSGRGEVMVQEEYGLPHKIKVLVSEDLGLEELVVVLKDLTVPRILHQEIPRKMLYKIRKEVEINNVQNNIIRGDQGSDQMEMKEQRKERERASGIFLYLEHQQIY